MIKCRKLHYQTKQIAKTKRRSLKSLGVKGKLRIYKCEYCEGFHLTSYDAKSITKMKDKLQQE